MTPSRRLSPAALGRDLALALSALRAWGPRQVLVSLAGATAVLLVVGLATVLIPNPVFARDIPPVWWNYPVLVVTSMLSGMLIATYVGVGETVSGNGSGDGGGPGDGGERPAEDGDRRSSRLGLAGGILAWFAVGCPVCNKLALIALGYSGAITWFAPLQPVLAVAALLLTGVALVVRLRGQVACPVRPAGAVAAR
ncbi:MAG: hypothetical protein ACTHW7_13585 [Actinomycetaceae bacterium]